MEDSGVKTRYSCLEHGILWVYSVHNVIITYLGENRTVGQDDQTTHRDDAIQHARGSRSRGSHRLSSCESSSPWPAAVRPPPRPPRHPQGATGAGAAVMRRSGRIVPEEPFALSGSGHGYGTGREPRIADTARRRRSSPNAVAAEMRRLRGKGVLPRNRQARTGRAVAALMAIAAAGGPDPARRPSVILQTLNCKRSPGAIASRLRRRRPRRQSPGRSTPPFPAFRGAPGTHRQPR